MDKLRRTRLYADSAGDVYTHVTIVWSFIIICGDNIYRVICAYLWIKVNVFRTQDIKDD